MSESVCVWGGEARDSSLKKRLVVTISTVSDLYRFRYCELHRRSPMPNYLIITGYTEH